MTGKQIKQINTELRKLADSYNQSGHTIDYGTAVDHIHRTLGIVIHWHDPVLSKILSDMLEEDHIAGAPLTPSAFVNRATGYPGVGYFKKLKDLGYDIGTNKAENIMAWVKQREDFANRKFSCVPM